MRRSRAEWLDLVSEFERSPESHEEFCVQRDLNVWSFRSWLYRLRKEHRRGKVARSATPRLLPVRADTGAAVAQPSFVEIAVPGSLVRIATGTDVAYVVELVSQLRARC
jgi:hypothetical protein